MSIKGRSFSAGMILQVYNIIGRSLLCSADRLGILKMQKQYGDETKAFIFPRGQGKNKPFFVFVTTMVFKGA
jgi:hypothetical protein